MTYISGCRAILGSLIALVMYISGATSSYANCAKIQPTRPGEIYFMRGLANIFSLGLDAFGKEVSAAGIENCVFNHSHWKSLVNDIVERSYENRVSHPIIIIGHSLGANIAPQMATAIGKHGIPVAYVVMLDPVEPTHVGANVEWVTNYYLPHRKDNRLYPLPGFSGELQNVNVKRFGGFDHFNIDENRELRNVIESRIMALTDPSGYTK